MSVCRLSVSSASNVSPQPHKNRLIYVLRYLCFSETEEVELFAWEKKHDAAPKTIFHRQSLRRNAKYAVNWRRKERMDGRRGGRKEGRREGRMNNCSWLTKEKLFLSTQCDAAIHCLRPASVIRFIAHWRTRYLDTDTLTDQMLGIFLWEGWFVHRYLHRDLRTLHSIRLHARLDAKTADATKWMHFYFRFNPIKRKLIFQKSSVSRRLRTVWHKLFAFNEKSCFTRVIRIRIPHTQMKIWKSQSRPSMVQWCGYPLWKVVSPCSSSHFGFHPASLLRREMVRPLNLLCISLDDRGLKLWNSRFAHRLMQPHTIILWNDEPHLANVLVASRYVIYQIIRISFRMSSMHFVGNELTGAIKGQTCTAKRTF